MELHEADYRVILLGTLVIIVFVSLFVFLILNNYRKNVKRQIDELKLIYAAEEKERSRIALELHDELGFTFSAINVHNQLIQNSNDNDSVSRSTLKISEILDLGSKNLKKILVNSIPKSIEQGGILPATYDLVNLISDDLNLRIRVTSSGIIPRFNDEVELSIFRIIQELINNSIKHADPTEINLNLEVTNSKFMINLEDNGRGIDVQSLNEQSLRSIKKRIQATNGLLEVSKGHSAGSAFCISFHIKDLQRQQMFGSTN